MSENSIETKYPIASIASENMEVLKASKVGSDQTKDSKSDKKGLDKSSEKKSEHLKLWFLPDLQKESVLLSTKKESLLKKLSKQEWSLGLPYKFPKDEWVLLLNQEYRKDHLLESSLCNQLLLDLSLLWLKRLRLDFKNLKILGELNLWKLKEDLKLSSIEGQNPSNKLEEVKLGDLKLNLEDHKLFRKSENLKFNTEDQNLFNKLEELRLLQGGLNM